MSTLAGAPKLPLSNMIKKTLQLELITACATAQISNHRFISIFVCLEENTEFPYGKKEHRLKNGNFGVQVPTGLYI